MADQYEENNIYLNEVYKQLADRRPGAADGSELSDLQYLMFSSRKRTTDPKMPSARRMAAALRKVVAERFVQARELNGLSQTEASHLMGYRKSTQLSLWEHGNRLPPIDRMIVASLVYGVSLDFLFGLIDDPDRDQQLSMRKSLARSLEATLKTHVEAIAETMLVFSKTGGINTLTIKALVARASEAAASMRRFAELNTKKFDDMRGSATVLHACVSLEALVREASAMLQRADGIGEQAIQNAQRRISANHPLFDTPEYRQQSLLGVD